MQPSLIKEPKNTSTQNEGVQGSGADATNSNQSPQLNLPSGGGAISGIGEKFSVNVATGTGATSVPVYASPARSEFGPQLSISYNSGAGNGTFGLGWSLSLPQVSRKTDKGLPRYLDAVESDVFLLSGAEDLVPELVECDCCPTGASRYRLECGYSCRNDLVREVNGKKFCIRKYRPRVEGLFARIERWTNVENATDVHWRSISKDNLLSVYGKDVNSRIADPEDLARIFSWLICETRDTKGNVVAYEYKCDDGAGVDLCDSRECNRGPLDDPKRTTNRYLKRIHYGNCIPALDENGNRPVFAESQSLNWMFELVFDYGEHDLECPTPCEEKEWDFRHDPFSSYRSGFEIRTTRGCRRTLMFHNFPEEEGVGSDCLVKSTDFTYDETDDPTGSSEPFYSRLTSVTQSGYKRTKTEYVKRSLPPLEFEYSLPAVQDKIEEVDASCRENLPVGLDGTAYRWVDLHGEGISGVLTEQAGRWFYKRNLSPLTNGCDELSWKPDASSREAFSNSTHADVKDRGKALDHSVHCNSHKQPDLESATTAKFAPTELVKSMPNTSLSSGAQLLDLAGDGQLDLVTYDPGAAGFYEHDLDESWKPFRPFRSRLNRNVRDPNLKFIDLDGDGHADILITEDDAFVWHKSEAESGFGDARRVAQVLDEEQGPRVVFADAEQSVYTADMSGDGLTDIVRIRNGSVCYWPNMGYGKFGSKITMDNSPRFDHPEQFDHKRIRLADIDGSGTTDIIYLRADGVRLYFNQSGNGWSQQRKLDVFPRVDDLAHIVPIDLLGNGTSCLVWSSPLLSDSSRPMRYVNLMGGVKPHLLLRSKNNLGAETEIQYSPSTKFYLQDKRDGKPWITRLPFPVHVVERVITHDRISGNRFVSRYNYHHGFFDGVEREFRGFGMVEQFDTESLAALAGDRSPDTGSGRPSNEDLASHVPPVLTRTWFHTGAHIGRNRISNYFAGLLNEHDRGEYYREPTDCSLEDGDAQAVLSLLPDTILPSDLTLDEERESCRALKGSMLRQEVFALDGKDISCENPFGHPYTVTEQNFAVELLQPKGDQSHAVFFTHPREAINYHYERNPVDPRISHTMTLEVDDFGNVLREVSIAYGRRKQVVTFDRLGRLRVAPNPELVQLDRVDQVKQTRPLISYTKREFTNAIDEQGGQTDDFLAPQIAEERTYELTGIEPDTERFLFNQWTHDRKLSSYRRNGHPSRKRGTSTTRQTLHDLATEIFYEATPDHNTSHKRLIEQVRAVYRSNDLTSLLPLGKIESRVLAGQSYKLAFTPGLLSNTFQRPRVTASSAPTTGDEHERFLPNPADVLAVDPSESASDRGGYVDLDDDGHWWIPSGRSFLSPNTDDTPDQELAFARKHFFLDRRYRDPFHTESASTETLVTYDDYDLLVVDTRDAVGNQVTAGERDVGGTLTRIGNDYRVLQPRLVMDPNRNRSAVAFDALCMVVGTSVMGKPEESLGDSLDGFEANLADEVELAHLADPHRDPISILGKATTRLVYDLFAFHRSACSTKPQPAVACTIARETHESDLSAGETTKVQHSFSYSDGFGREIQKKAQAEPGRVPLRDDNGNILVNEHNQPQISHDHCEHRWVGSGWTVFNNKGKPVRQFEPFFTDTHRFESDVRIGVSAIRFYDPVERVIATLHPNHTCEKIVFDPWMQVTWDVNDTVLLDPRTDADIAGFVKGWSESLPMSWQTWYATRQCRGSLRGPTLDCSAILDDLEQQAANKTAAHADTPIAAYLDSLGRTFLTVNHNRVACQSHDLDRSDEKYSTRVELDIEGNQRIVRDSIVQNDDRLGRVVMRYDYDMLGNRIHQASMEAGERWTLNDVSGKPIQSWDNRGHQFTSHYDTLRRPAKRYLCRVVGCQPANQVTTRSVSEGQTSDDAQPQSNDPSLTRRIANPILIERVVYGEQHPDATNRNLRGQAFRQLDQSGAVATEQFDFKGNVVSQNRHIANEFKQSFDWSPVDDVLPDKPDSAFDPRTFDDALDRLTEPDVYNSSSTFDALGRPVELTTPHTTDMKPNVIRHRFNEANLLEQVDANLQSATQDDQPVWTPFVNNIDYDAKGQRQRIDYGNGASTFYEYDPLTFRLTRLRTKRNRADFSDDSPKPKHDGWPGCDVQNLSYTYDPVGNIIHIRDDAQQTIFFRNQRVEPGNDYTYDAIYRLIEASGREHLGQAGGSPIPHSPNDAPRVGLLHPGDGNAVGNYVERYIYDSVGNFLQMQHRGTDPQHAGWTRLYQYNEPSLTEPEKQSNRLSVTQIRGGTPVTERYAHDAHGNITFMPHLGGSHPNSNMHWDHQDQLQQVDLPDGRTAHYTYDAAGERVRKVIWASETHYEERLYLGGFEIYRQQKGDDLLERETLHIMDDQQRIALIETRTADSAGEDKSPEQLIRFQLNNHLGSASVELDHQSLIISYEEYTPYGNSSYRACRSRTEVPRRYSFTGKERDEESGFYYHGFRYFAPWLGRWTSTDPIGIDDHINLYVYTRNNPVNTTDPTGLWSWRKIAVVAAAVTVGVVVTVATAGAAAPLAAAAVASIGLSGTAAAVATGTVVGVVSGAVGGAAAGAAAESTRQTVNSRALGLGNETFSASRIGQAAAQGSEDGAIIGGAIGGALPVLAAAGSAAASTAIGTAVIGKTTQFARTAALAGRLSVSETTAARVAATSRAVTQPVRAVGSGLRRLHSAAARGGERLATSLPGRVGQHARSAASARAAQRELASSSSGSANGSTQVPRPNSTTSVYHKGNLEGGQASSTRTLSTGTNRQTVEALDRAGTVHQFDVPNDVLRTWETQGLARRFRDLDAATGVVNEEIRFSGTVSKALNGFRQ